MCDVDALQGSVTVQSQLHTEAQPQRHLSCAASLVSVPGDMSSRPVLPKSSQLRAPLAVQTLIDGQHSTDSRVAQAEHAAATAAHNTAHLTLAASTASGEPPESKLGWPSISMQRSM